MTARRALAVGSDTRHSRNGSRAAGDEPVEGRAGASVPVRRPSVQVSRSSLDPSSGHGSAAPDPASGLPEKSFTKDFPRAAHAEILRRAQDTPGARNFDPHRYRALFPERWAAFLRAHHRNVLEVAVMYDVTERTARNWWEGANRPSGDVVAIAACTWPESFSDHFGGGSS